MADAATPFARTAHRSFIDLRAFAAHADRVTGGANAFLDNRRLLDLPQGPVTIGTIALDGGRGAVRTLAADEFVVVLSGAVTFEQDGRSIVLTEGRSAVLPRGAAFDWSGADTATLLFMRYSGASEGDGRIVPIDEAAPLQPSGAPLAELLIGPAPSCRNHTDYRSTNGEFLCGTWDSTPYHRRAMAYRHYELMHLLGGAVTFEDEAGLRRTFSKGDIFLVEQHAQCSWESTVDVAKIYAIYRPA